RTRSAERGIEEMHQCVDTLLVIPNQNLFRLANEHTTFADAFAMADDVLYSGVRTFTDLMIKHGLINLDFADICAVMREMMGKAMMGTGQASGERRAIEAAEHAISCPLLDNDVSMRGARAVLINISGGLDMTLFEVDEAANRIREEVDPNANIIFGATFDESISGHLRVSVVATGIDAKDLLAGAASEGSFKTTPRSVFRLGGQRLGEDLLEDTPGPQESLVSEEFVAPEAPPEELKKNHEKPFGRRHDLFSMDYEMASSRAQRGESFDESFEEQEGPYPLEMEEEDLEKLYPQSAKKSTAMTFLERLGVSRRNPPPPVAPEKKASPVSSRKKPDVLDLSSEGPTDLLDRDSLEIPAFMRNKRKNY
ncbi:MAG: cell division protein FtsZ, partial [Holosporales bacterium]